MILMTIYKIVPHLTQLDFVQPCIISLNDNVCFTVSCSHCQQLFSNGEYSLETAASMGSLNCHIHPASGTSLLTPFTMDFGANTFEHQPVYYTIFADGKCVNNTPCDRHIKLFCTIKLPVISVVSNKPKHI